LVDGRRIEEYDLKEDLKVTLNNKFLSFYLNLFLSVTHIKKEDGEILRFKLGIWHFKPIWLTFCFPFINKKIETTIKYNFKYPDFMLSNTIYSENDRRIWETGWTKTTKEDAKCQN
jgi:hypothetical protein